jgi:Na+/melibiose symporter-like transporter
VKSLSPGALLSYGLFGLPLALLALPIYVYVPQFYATHFEMSLALIGSTLLIARILDAFFDPMFGLWIDKQRGSNGYSRVIAISIPLMTAGFVALFYPPQSTGTQLFFWFLGSLIVVYLGFSLASIAYQSWGAALDQTQSQRSSITGVREVCGLIGVIIAAALPAFTGICALPYVFVLTLLIAAYFLLRHAPKPGLSTGGGFALSSLLQPLRNSRFRWLIAVFILNGIAAAIPATLFLFYTNDRLLLQQYAGLFLVEYFLAAALFMPVWVTLAKRHGEKKSWMIAMGLAIFTFIWAYFLGAGEVAGFAVICILSGAALGADLALPPALLAAVIGQAGHIEKYSGTYFGIWNWATKLNLALAAGIALPMLQWMGYQSGSHDAAGLHALAVGYALLPCVFKFGALLLLWRAPLNQV